jgi:hypothetical protein
MTFSKLLVSAAFAAAAFASSAFAAPAPAQVEEAIRAQNWPVAEQLLKQVVAEKPGSAKAWYYLAQTEEKLGKNSAALEDLRRSETIDHSLKFASPGEPAAMERRLNQAMAPRAVIVQPAPVNTHVARVDSGMSAFATFMLIMFAAFAVFGFGYLIYRLFFRPTIVVANSGAAYVPAGGYAPAAPMGYAPAYAPGSTVVVNGGHSSTDLLTTMIVADAISDHHHHNHGYDRDYDYDRAPSASYSSPSYSAPAEPSRSASSFDLGGGSSSSWDSGSSSSSFDSGSSSTPSYSSW